MNRASARVYARSTIFQFSALPSWFQSFGSCERQEGGLDRGDRRRDVRSRDLLEGTGVVASDDVEIDLDRTAGPAGLGQPMVSPVAVRQLDVCGCESSPRSTRTLLASIARNCGAKPWSDPTNVVGSLPMSLRASVSTCVGALVGVADEPGAGTHAPVAGPVHLDVVVGRVGLAVGQLLRDEPEELVLELIGDRIPGEQEIRLVGLDHVLEHRVMGLGPVQPLLDVGLFADDARFEDGEVGRGRGGELLGEELIELGDPGLAREAGPARVRAGDRRVEQADAREVLRSVPRP